MAKALRGRAKELQAQTLAKEPSAAAELKELESRDSLREHQQTVESEIEREKRLAAYRQCIDDTSTQAIARKSTELTKRLVTDQLQRCFQDELYELEFKHLAVEIQPASGAGGALYHRLVFTNAPGVAVTDVLSEGESRPNAQPAAHQDTPSSAKIANPLGMSIESVPGPPSSSEIA